jgi:hypothetical protein
LFILLQVACVNRFCRRQRGWSRRMGEGGRSRAAPQFGKWQGEEGTEDAHHHARSLWCRPTPGSLRTISTFPKPCPFLGSQKSTFMGRGHIYGSQKSHASLRISSRRHVKWRLRCASAIGSWWKEASSKKSLAPSRQRCPGTPAGPFVANVLVVALIDRRP